MRNPLPKHVIRVCEDVEDLGRRAAEAAAGIINSAIEQRGGCSIAFAGGNTPRPMYRELASRFRDRIQWTRVHAFWGDERFVPSGDPRRNETMVRSTLLDHVPCPPENVHPVPDRAASAEDAARQYEAVLRREFSKEWPRFDLVLLGLGADGHTASLFPGSPALGERTRWVAAAMAAVDPPARVTLTVPVLNHAAATFFLVDGSSKAHALRQVLNGGDTAIYPAAAVHPADGVVWWVDREAAGALENASLT
jgi:6-phosphogluconolactonase